jgi:hypothetical protein
MADNVTVSNAPLTNYPVATDDDGTAQHQLVKIEFGGDGVFTRVDGTNRLPVAVGGTVSVSEQATIITGAAAQTAVINNILPSVAGVDGTDVANFRAATVQVASTGTAGTFIFEQSNNGVNWVPLPVFNAALTTGVPIVAAITATASAIVYSFPLRCNFVRLRIATLITGGSIQAFSRISTEPWTPAVATVAQPTAASLNATVAGTVTANISAPALPTANILNSAATANPTIVKGSAGTLYSITASNTNAAIRYLKIHNSTTVVPGTTAVALTIPIPPGGVVTIPFGSQGMRFATGICLSTTTGAADTDATAVAAGEIKVLTSFI